MKKEDLFRAIGDVGEDLIHMAEHRRFSGQWKKWLSTAASIVLIVSLGALALPYFPIGCGSKSAAPEMAAPEEPKYSMDVMDQESKTEEAETPEAPMEAPMEAEPEAEEAAPMEPNTGASTNDAVMEEPQDEAVRKDVTQITICSTIYYLRPGIVKEGEKPGNIGQYVGDVEDSDNEAYIGCPVYEMAHTVWYSNHAVDGQSVPAEILVEGPNGWIAGFTGNEKTVSRYTAADVQAAIDRGDDQWILDTFVAPVEMYGPIRFPDSTLLEADQLVQMFLASTHLNTGVQVRAWQMKDHGWSIPFEDLEQRLGRFLDDFTFDPNQLSEDQLGTQDGEPVLVFVWQDDTEPQPIDGLYLKFAGLEDDLLYLHVGLPETDDLYDEVHYRIRFDEDSWRYLLIETPG